jgi:hypothetical protein
MKTTAIGLALLAASLVGGSGTSAQKVVPKPATSAPAPDLSKINAGKVLQELQTMTAITNTSDGQEVTPLTVIAQFLQLQPAQITQLEQLLQARQQNLVPRVQQMQALGQQLDALLNSGGNPVQVGATVIQIHVLQVQIAQVQQAFLTQLGTLLDADQLQRLQAVQIAVQLQPILPAFQLIFPF